jgi:arylsulfatase A-like enzyme
MARTVRYTPWLIGYTDITLDPRRFHPNDPRVGTYEQVLPGLQQFAPGSEEASGDPAWWAQLRELGYDHWDQPFRQKPEYTPTIDTQGPTYAPSIVKAEHGLTAFVANQALRFFRQYAGAPWFLHVSFQRPHPPFVAHEPYHDMYSLEDVPDFQALPSLEDERAIHPFMPFRLERLEMNPTLPIDISHPNDSRAWRQARATYYGLISELDHHIGRMIAALNDLGVYDKTLIIFTSDHGEMLGDHWCWGKETPFDGAVRVPCIVRSPVIADGARGRVVEQFSEHLDIMPTVLDHIGVEVPLQCDGRSLHPFLEAARPRNGATRRIGSWISATSMTTASKAGSASASTNAASRSCARMARSMCISPACRRSITISRQIRVSCATCPAIRRWPQASVTWRGAC